MEREHEGNHKLRVTLRLKNPVHLRDQIARIGNMLYYGITGDGIYTAICKREVTAVADKIDRIKGIYIEINHPGIFASWPASYAQYESIGSAGVIDPGIFPGDIFIIDDRGGPE